MFMSNYLTANSTSSTTGGFFSDTFGWLKKNISVGNINRLGTTISNFGTNVADAINKGKKAITGTAEDIGAAAGKGFFDQNKWWIFGGLALVAIAFAFSFSRRK